MFYKWACSNHQMFPWPFWLWCTHLLFMSWTTWCYHKYTVCKHFSEVLEFGWQSFVKIPPSTKSDKNVSSEHELLHVGLWTKGQMELMKPSHFPQFTAINKQIAVCIWNNWTWRTEACQQMVWMLQISDIYMSIFSHWPSSMVTLVCSASQSQNISNIW
jgi:hypothetical protein